MVASVKFVRPIESALSELKALYSKAGLIFTGEEEVNKGAGIKLFATIDDQPVTMILYFNRSKGYSSKIIIEKAPDNKKDLLINSLSSISTRNKTKAISIHTTITVADKKLRQVIRDAITSTNITLIERDKQSHMDYLVKLKLNDNELTLTQFSSGALLLQGVYSDLLDRVVDIVDQIKPLTTEERALLYASEDTQKLIGETILENSTIFDEAIETAEALPSDYYNYLFDNDRKSYVTGNGLTKILENYHEALPEYNFLVAIFAKVFEGFLIKLLIEKNFFTLQEYSEKPDIADIGIALRKKKLAKYIKDHRRYGYVIEQLIAVWEGCRCKEMHSDPVAEQSIISVSTLGDAKNKIGEIKACMKNVYDILIRYGYTDKDLAQKKSIADTEVTVESPPILKSANGYIGTDESGKGDYFGPLVIAGVFLDEETERKLADAGVRDSKTISDNRIHEFAKMIMAYVDKSQYSVVAIGPEKYNELYSKIGNLNKLLAWGHARALENILTSVECDKAIADQFGDESFIKQALLERGKSIQLIQMPKAEQNTAVAAASVLARSTFLLRLSELSKQFGVVLPKGASSEVEKAARQFIAKHGKDVLAKCAKLHFKTTNKL